MLTNSSGLLSPPEETQPIMNDPQIINLE